MVTASEVAADAKASSTETAETSTTDSTKSTSTSSSTSTTSSTDSTKKDTATTTTTTPTSSSTSGTVGGTLNKTTATAVSTKPKLPDPVAYVEEVAVSTEDMSLGDINPGAKATFTASQHQDAEVLMPAGMSAQDAELSDMVAQEKMIGLLALYRKSNVYNSKDTTPEGVAKSIKALAAVVSLAVSRPTMMVLQPVLDFFKAERDTVLQPNYALQGADNLGKELRMTVTLFYQIFYNITSGSNKKMNVSLIRSVFRASGDALINFLVRHGLLVTK